MIYLSNSPNACKTETPSKNPRKERSIKDLGEHQAKEMFYLIFLDLG
jgi:hypothetical protein